MRPLRTIVVSASLVLLGLSSAAHAQGQRDPAMDSTIKELFDKGVKAAARGEWAECRGALLTAWASRKDYRIAGNLAECEAKLGRWADAANHISFALREMPKDAPKEKRAPGESLLADARSRVAEVTVRVDTDEADVLLDTELVGRAPLPGPIFIAPGKHTISARVGGRPAVDEEIDAVAGSTREVVLSMRTDTSPPAPATAAPPVPTATSSAPTTEPPSRSMVPVVVGGVVAVVGIGVGLGLLGAAAGKDSDAEDLAKSIKTDGGTCGPAPPAQFQARCDDYRDLASEHDTLQTVGIISAAVGGAAAAFALGYLLWPSQPNQKTTGAQVKAGAFFLPGASGATLSGRF